jgi:hypothetical protein
MGQRFRGRASRRLWRGSAGRGELRLRTRVRGRSAWRWCRGIRCSRRSTGRCILRLRRRPLSCWFRNRLARWRAGGVVFTERGVHSAIALGQVYLELAHLGGRRKKVRVQLDLGFILGLLAFENECLEGAGGGRPFRVGRRLDKDLVDVGGGRVELESILGDGLVVIDIASGENAVGWRCRRWCRWRRRRRTARGRRWSGVGVGRGRLRRRWRLSSRGRRARRLW